MTIKDWLNSNRNFDIGVALYNTYGTDDLLKKMFGQGFSETRAKRLFQELLYLKEIDNLYQPEASPEPVNVNVAAATMPEQTVAAESDPYRSKWLPLYQEMNMLRHNLESINDNKKRGIAAFRILSLEQNCMAIWEQRDYFLKTGSKIEDADQEEPFVDISILQKRIYTVRSFISKYSKPPVTDRRTALLKKYQDEMTILKKQLGNNQM